MADAEDTMVELPMWPIIERLGAGAVCPCSLAFSVSPSLTAPLTRSVFARLFIAWLALFKRLMPWVHNKVVWGLDADRGPPFAV